MQKVTEKYEIKFFIINCLEIEITERIILQAFEI